MKRRIRFETRLVMLAFALCATCVIYLFTLLP